LVNRIIIIRGTASFPKMGGGERNSGGGGDARGGKMRIPIVRKLDKNRKRKREGKKKRKGKKDATGKLSATAESKFVHA